MRTLPLLLALGCAPLYIPPAPPTYTDGVPSDRVYEDAARSTIDIDKLGVLPADPTLALEHCRALITDRGWTLVKKTADPGTQWGQFSTTSGNALPVVLLGSDWDARPVERQATTMCHEAVHTFQIERMGDAVILPTYLINEGAWSIEVPAYRVSLRLWRAHHPDATLADVEAKARDYATKLYDKYGLTNMPRQYAIDTAVAILMLDHR